MNDADKVVCEPCRQDSPPATGAEVETFIANHPGWVVADVKGEPQVQRQYTFPDFAAALAFANKVGALAEEQNHHPLLQVEWGKVLVAWWTHKIKNIHKNDLIMAARTDELFGG
jgi:4a-hydroxytetrahydrobiopterin dehydratase